MNPGETKMLILGTISTFWSDIRYCVVFKQNGVVATRGFKSKEERKEFISAAAK